MTESIAAPGDSQGAIPCGQDNNFVNIAPIDKWNTFPAPTSDWWWDGFKWIKGTSQTQIVNIETRLSNEDIDAIAIRVARLLREKI